MQMNGAIESWDTKAGFGVVRGEDAKTYLAHFSDFEEYKKSGKRISMEPGQDVSFTPSETKGRAKAECLVYDNRMPLFQFAYFHDFEGAIEELATKHAVPEKWSSSSFNKDDLQRDLKKTAEERNWLEVEKEKQQKKFGKVDESRARKRIDQKIQAAVTRKQYDVLFSYFARTYERLRLENKIEFSDDSAAFNTGLGNKFDKDVYAVFKRSKDTVGDKASPYVFEKFADENFVGKNFPKIPELAGYFVDLSTKSRVPSDHLMFDVDLRLFPDDSHLFDERRARFPDSWQGMSDEECANRFEQLLERTRSRVKRNFRAAVPFYYPALRKIQLLLPITFNPGADSPDTRALVVSREGAGYSVETIMPLEWAYKNARLLAKPDREDWLDF